MELGTFSGESYFALCQAAREARTGSRAYAVDTWEGDDHTGALDASAFQAVDAHNRAHYAAFSLLIRGTFDSARPQFTDGSIDLLHIDGLHTYEAVRHDFENWRAAVRPGGVVLFHDTAARHADFGVWRLWEELAREAPGRVFEFRHGYGLGVLRLDGPEPVSPFLRALSGADERAAAALREYYEQAAEELRRRKTYPGAVAAPADPTDRSGELAVPATRPTVGLQVFFPRSGPYDELNSYREADSLIVQFSPGRWRRVVVPLPEDYTGGPLRLDPVNCFGLVDIAGICMTSRVMTGSTLWLCRTKADLDRLIIRGTARAVPHPRVLSLFSPGLDPVLLLPAVDLAAAGAVGEPLQLEVWLRARATWGDLAGPVSEWLEAHAQRAELTTTLAGLRAELDAAPARARTEWDQALSAQAEELAAVRAELEAARAQNLAETNAELEAARTERLMAVTDANICRRELGRLKEQLAEESRAKLDAEAHAAAREVQQRQTWEAEVAAARVHSRNLSAIGDQLQLQIEAERDAAVQEMQRWRDAVAEAELRQTQLEAERERERARSQGQQTEREQELEARVQELTREQERALFAERTAGEERLLIVAGHLAETEKAYRTELAQRRAMQSSLSWKLGRPWRRIKGVPPGETDAG